MEIPLKDPPSISSMNTCNRFCKFWRCSSLRCLPSSGWYFWRNLVKKIPVLNSISLLFWPFFVLVCLKVALTFLTHKLHFVGSILRNSFLVTERLILGGQELFEGQQLGNCPCWVFFANELWFKGVDTIATNYNLRLLKVENSVLVSKMLTSDYALNGSLNHLRDMDAFCRCRLRNHVCRCLQIWYFR